MILAVIFLILPFVVYFGLASLPAGRPSRIGIMLVAVPVAALWLADIFTIGPIFTGDWHADNFTIWAVIFYTAAWVLAIVAQTLGRALARRWPKIGYGPFVLLNFGLPALPALKLLGL